MMRHVIIGNGVAGIKAAETIRSLSPDAAITMIAAEQFLPYSRPLISLVLEGSLPPEKIRIRPEDFYEQNRIEPLIGHRVVELDVDKRHVKTHLELVVPFDRLLIASGADPRPIKAVNSDLPGIFYMRTEAQVNAMIRTLDQVSEAVVLGGGLVGFKAAYGLMHRGVKVTMLIKSGYPLSMQVDEPAGQLILDKLLSRGLEVRVGVEVLEFFGNGLLNEVYLSDGNRLPCQLAVIGKGVLPAVDFVPRDRIDIDLGIRVDHHLETSETGIFAAGDVAEAVDVIRGVPWVNAIWPVAVEQGFWAGMNMAGRQAFYPGSMGRNVIRVFDMDVLTGGLVNPVDDKNYQIFMDYDRNKTFYRKLVVLGDKLVGLAMVGGIDQGGILLALMQQGRPLHMDPEDLLSPRFNYRLLMG